ncbi:MAG: hypothetical protein WCI18_17350, partial [Pseudomonadota bacterium]
CSDHGSRLSPPAKPVWFLAGSGRAMAGVLADNPIEYQQCIQGALVQMDLRTNPLLEKCDQYLCTLGRDLLHHHS